MGSKFKQIKVWEKAHQLTLEIYRITISFPQHEIYGITSQIRRASSSIPANIVEGYSRGSTKQYINFLNIANGSLSETTYFLILAHDLNYIDSDKYKELEQQCEEIGKMLNATIKTLKGRDTMV